MKTATLKSNLLLIITSAIWGFGFVAQRAGMDHLGPFAFNAIRFAMGGLVLLPFVIVGRRRRSGGPGRDVDSGELKYRRDADGPIRRRHEGSPRRGNDDEPTTAPSLRASIRSALPGGMLAGLVLFGGASLQQMGLVHTSAGKAGFITGLYMIIVPLMGLLWRQRANRGTWLGAVLATVGLYLLSVPETGGILPGDLLVLVGAFFWAGHVQLIDRLIERHDPLVLACVQFLGNALMSLIVSLIFESSTMAAISGAALPLLYSGFLSVGVGYTLQVVAQREAHPAHAAIFLSLESVFALVGGWLILSERMAGRGLTGCALMLAGMLFSQLALGRKSRADNIPE